MASICFYFQIHQPPRLRRYSVFDTEASYFDETRNRRILDRIVERCYLPATQLILKLVQRHEGRFRVAYSLTGCVIEQLRRHHPQVIALFQQLAETGCVEFLGETYYHSLSFLYSRDEFKAQVALHADTIYELFGQRPTVFRNTELIYNNELAEFIAATNGYGGILTEGVDHLLGDRSAAQLYQPPRVDGVKLLLKNYRLSDDIAFRFSNRDWTGWPLTADKFARWIHNVNDQGKVCNLFIDYETFGEHQWRETGIFQFLEALPAEVFKIGGDDFRTPGECVRQIESSGVYDVPYVISWADTERDLSAWLGNAMQSNALQELYKLEASVKAGEDPDLISDWRNLTTSDHFYYMCTKYFADGDVHKYFNPYESPYDSYINFMNVLDNLRTRAETGNPTPA